MRVNIYLHDEIANTLKCFGDLSDVVNRILQTDIDIMDKPKCPPKENGNKYIVEVINLEYLSLYKQFGPSSSRISLRRLLYWFVENEIYEELGWIQTNTYCNKNDERCYKKIDSAIDTLNKAITYTNSSYNKQTLNNIIKQLGELK